MKDFIGNKSVRALLHQSVQRNSLSHAYIFAGPDGVGKKRLALALTKSLLCRNRPEGLNPCGTCSSCRKIDAEEHPDVQVIRPEKKVFKIDQIRQLIQDICFQPIEGAWRVFILDDADRMNEQASNSLLKTMEEPPSNSLLILVTSNLYILLPTIQSRGQILKFNPIPSKEIEHFLKTRHDFSPEHALAAARLCQGSVGTALRISMQTFEDMRTMVFQMFGAMEEGRDAMLVKIAGEVAGLKEMDLFLHVFVSVLRDLMLLEYFKEETCLLHRHSLETLLQLKRTFSLDELHCMLKELENFHRKRVLNLRPDVYLMNFALRHGARTR